MVFLERLQAGHPLPASHIHRLGEVYSLNTTGNCEIRLRWYGLALASGAAKDYAKAAVEWVVDAKTGLKGRMKYCRPTFKAVFKVETELAKKTFLKHATEFHPIARQLIKKVRISHSRRVHKLTRHFYIKGSWISLKQVKESICKVVVYQNEREMER